MSQINPHPQYVDGLELRIRELSEQLAALRKDASSKWAFLEWRDRAEKAEAENAALQKDAARYRWLRDDKRGRSLSVSSLEWTGSAELSDAAVDAAKEEGK